MIDNLSILLSHTLLLVMMWRLLSRPDLDREEPASVLRERARAERGDEQRKEEAEGWLPKRGIFARREKADKSGWRRDA